MLSETGEKEEKVDGYPEEVETVEVHEVSNVLRSVSISEDISEGLDQIGDEDNLDKQRIDAMRVELLIIADDIEDFIDENEVDENSTTTEVDCKISKIEEVRTSYRNLQNELKILSEASYEELYGRDKERQLSLMKDYIKKGNNLKKYAAAKKSEADIKVNISKARSEMFLVQEVKTSISYLQEIFKVDVSNINDDEIKSRKDDMPKHLQQLDNLSKKMQNLLECANSVIEDQIEDIVGSYNHIKKLKDVYQQTIKDEVVKREISKLELFNESKLKINLSKFSGYNSKLDVYTFQSEFIKIYKRTTPKRMMSDVLKNNHLEGSALSLVRIVDNI